MTETEAAQDWISTTLEEDASLNLLVGGRIYKDYLPQKVKLPCIVIVQQELGPDQAAINGSNSVVSCNFAVLGVDKDTSPSSIAVGIQSAIHAQHNVTHEGYEVVHCSRVSPIDEPPDKFSGFTYKFLGALYEIMIV